MMKEEGGLALLEDKLFSNHSNYDASQIQVLEGLEAVRGVRHVYSTTGSRGLHQLVYEIGQQHR